MTQAIAQYDRLAATYDRRWRCYLDETIGRAASYVEGLETARCLDVACGTGALIARLHATWPQATLVGLDGSAAMLARAIVGVGSSRYVTLCQGVVEALPIATATCDWVACTNAFHYFPQPTSVLAEMHRVLKPNGRLLLLDWCRDGWHCRILNRWLRLTDPGHVWMYTQREWRRLLDAERFTVERMERFHAPWLFGWRVWEMMACVARAT